MNIDTTTLQLVFASITIMGSGRLGPTIAALIGLIGTVIGGLALVRSKRHSRSDTDLRSSDDRNRTAPALALGVISLVLGGLFLATADGGPGTGNGVVGSAAAIVLGSIGIILACLTKHAAHRSRDDLVSNTAAQPPR